MSLRIGTRGSALAQYQANLVKDLLAERLGRVAELVVVKTKGDQDRSRPIADLGVVGVFTKAIQDALLADEVDIAVHSLKDLPTTPTAGLAVAAHPERVDARDVLIARPDAVAPDAPGVPLEEGARVGTASVRRRTQLLDARPDLEVVGIRGNVPTRIGKARSGEVDAVVLAAAGVDRLEVDLADMHRHDLPAERFVPAPGQGALALEVRAADADLVRDLAGLDDAGAARATRAERALLHSLGAGCSVPLGALAAPEPDGRVRLRAVFGPGEAVRRPPLRRALVRADDPELAAALALRVLDPRSLIAAPPAGQPLAGRKVLVAREPDRAADLVAAVAAAGGEATCRPPSRVAPLADAAAAAAALDALPDGGWVLLTSANAARELAARLDDRAGELARRRIGAVGPATARALAELELPVDLLAGTADGAGLAVALQEVAGEPGQALLPAARGGRPELREALAASGWGVQELELYASEPLPPPDPAELARYDAVVLASPSGARALLPPGGDVPPLVAIGPTTAAAVAEQGRAAAATASEPTAAGLLEALIAAL